jgi:hypothetical protein
MGMAGAHAATFSLPVAAAPADDSTRKYWAEQRRQLQHLSDSIESAMVYKLLSVADGDACSARLAQIESACGDLRQTGHIEEQIAQVRRQIAALLEKRREEIQEDLRPVRGSADPRDLGIIDEAVKTDLPLATVYLMRLWEGQRLQEEVRDRDPFEELHGSTLARDIEAFLAGYGRHTDDLIQHIEHGRPIGALGFGGVPEAQRKEAGRLLQLWFALKTASGDHRVQLLQQLLTGLGFTGVRLPRGKAGVGDVLETEFECDPFADRSICPVPYYGSVANGHYRLLCVSESMSPTQFLTRVGPAGRAHPTIVLYPGRLTERQRSELASETRSRHCPCIVIDQVLLVFLTAERGSRLPALFACALPFAGIDPYITTSAFAPPELFFGRGRELERLLDPMGPWLVYGGRHSGKTALLKHAERTFHAPKQRRFAAWINLKTAGIGWTAETDSTHVWRPIRRRLVDVGLLPQSTVEPLPAVRGQVEHFLHALESWLAAHPEGRILLLLDEADRFLEDDARHAFRSASQLRRLMEISGHRFKVVLAGLHSVLRTAQLASHPLGHAGEPIELGPLTKRSEWREARRLVHAPLGAAGFRLEHAGMVDRILAQTSFLPSLIQLYCSKVVWSMNNDARTGGGPRYSVKETKLDEIFLGRELRDEVGRKFRLTLQLDPRYAVIAYALAYRSYEQGSRAGTFTAAELAQMARRWWPEGFANASTSEFRGTLEEMVSLGVLRRSGEEGPFTLRSPDLSLLMGSKEEVGAELQRQRDLPEVFAPQAFHPGLAGSGAIAGSHPLTMSQIGALVSSRAGVVILAGTRAAGIDRVTEALRHEHGQATLVCLDRVGEARSFAQDLRGRMSAPASDGSNVLLVPQDCPWSGAWVHTALDELRRLPAKNRRAKVVFIADAAAAVSAELPELADLQDVEVITLRPWDESFVRHWFQEMHPGDGPAQREALRARTGFWPLLLERAQSAAGLEMFVGRHARLGQLLVDLARRGGDAEPAKIAEINGESPQSVLHELKLGQLLGLVTAAQRDRWRLEQGLAALIRNAVLRT